MSEYLTELAYQRWFRKYQINYRYCVDLLSRIRLRLDLLSYDEDIKQIESLVDDIDKRLEEASPRDFNSNSEPLLGIEKFIENGKVLINLLLKLFKKENHFKGIYQAELERVMTIHQVYQFKDKLKEVRDQLEKIESKQSPDKVFVEEPIAL
jgi:hypothetical protein